MSHCSYFFFLNATATTEIYTLSLHDALPIWFRKTCRRGCLRAFVECGSHRPRGTPQLLGVRRSRTQGASSFGTSILRRDRKSTRLNSSHVRISYAVFCLKKKTKQQATTITIS